MENLMFEHNFKLAMLRLERSKVNIIIITCFSNHTSNFCMVVIRRILIEWNYIAGRFGTHPSIRFVFREIKLNGHILSAFLSYWFNVICLMSSSFILFPSRYQSCPIIFNLYLLKLWYRFVLHLRAGYLLCNIFVKVTSKWSYFTCQIEFHWKPEALQSAGII